jgi:hypothetical protein
MRVAFLTEMGFTGKVPINHPNMRTEFAWMFTLDADHHHIRDIRGVKDYDHVFIIFPKGKTFLSSEGSKIGHNINPVSDLIKAPLVSELKKHNKNVHYVQEGPHWWFNDYEVDDQIYFYNMLSECDSIFAHNESDVKYYKGLFPFKKIRPLRSLMIDELVKDLVPTKEEKVIIGGNFARWYGGFESYMVASNFDLPIWLQTSHAMRENEGDIDNIHHLPRMMWANWMETLSTFKYAVHLMPTVAAGTFAMNCAYFGIPCIGNKDVDTQRILFPNLSVDVNDVERARELALQLKNDPSFYNACSVKAKMQFEREYTKERWLEIFNETL